VTVASREFRGQPFSGDVPGVVAVTGVVAAGAEDGAGQHAAAGGEPAAPTGGVRRVHVSLRPVPSPAPSWSVGRGREMARSAHLAGCGCPWASQASHGPLGSTTRIYYAR